MSSAWSHQEIQSKKIKQFKISDRFENLCLKVKVLNLFAGETARTKPRVNGLFR